MSRSQRIELTNHKMKKSFIACRAAGGLRGGLIHTLERVTGKEELRITFLEFDILKTKSALINNKKRLETLQNI